MGFSPHSKWLNRTHGIDTYEGTALVSGQFVGIDRIAMLSVGDDYAPGAEGVSYIDNIVVSQVPEPGTILLVGLGGLLLRRRGR